MTRLTALRRYFVRPTSSDDEMLIGPDLVLPDLPAPGPVGQVILALFEGGLPFDDGAFDLDLDVEFGFERGTPAAPSLRLH